MFMNIGLILIGLVALFAGGDILVRGAVTLARRLSISDALIGLTVVGFGTSMPELLVSLKAGLANQPAIAVGNAVGSNTANILLIGGITLLIAPFIPQSRALKRDVLVALAIAVLLFAVAMTGAISRLIATGLLLFLVAYLIYAYRDDSNDAATLKDGGAQPAISGKALGIAVVFVLAGFALLFAGADWLVDGAVAIARDLGVPEAVIGLTIVAVGTSLPELAASIAAAFRSRPDVAIGNIIGSNIFNIAAILGITSLIIPLTIEPAIAQVDIPLMAVVTMIFAAFLFLRKSLGWMTGTALLTVYATYTWYLYMVA
ncbi:MAG: calcium/sodium antiporter [Rhizobiales bacterium]|nr:calcium/sodium antiporter [Hyphomicrobiales bacterium]